jgi:hypothetical protein
LEGPDIVWNAGKFSRATSLVDLMQKCQTENPAIATKYQMCAAEMSVAAAKAWRVTKREGDESAQLSLGPHTAGDTDQDIERRDKDLRHFLKRTSVCQRRAATSVVAAKVRGRATYGGDDERVQLFPGKKPGKKETSTATAKARRGRR